MIFVSLLSICSDIQNLNIWFSSKVNEVQEIAYLLYFNGLETKYQLDYEY